MTRELDRHMLQSDTWIRIKEVLDVRIELLRNRLEIEKEPSSISELQGAIKEIRLVLQLGKVRERLQPDAVLGF